MSSQERMRTCRRCGAELPAEQLVCPQCGNKQRTLGHIRCRTCGAVNSRSRTTCIACGALLRRRWVGPAILAIVVVAGLALLASTAPGLRQGLSRIPLVGQQSEDTAAGTAPIVVATETPSPQDTPTSAPTDTPRPTETRPPTETATRTPPPTWTSTMMPATPTPTELETGAPVDTATATGTATPPPTLTATPSPTASATPTPSPTATTPPLPSPSPTPRIYTVKSGDTLYDIATRFDTTINAIVQANGLKSTNLSIGQHLIIPAPTPTPTPAANAGEASI